MVKLNVMNWSKKLTTKQTRRLAVMCRRWRGDFRLAFGFTLSTSSKVSKIPRRQIGGGNGTGEGGGGVSLIYLPSDRELEAEFYRVIQAHLKAYPDNKTTQQQTKNETNTAEKSSSVRDGQSRKS